MTDNEIIKALECCGRNSIAGRLNECKNCPLNDRTTCISELMYNALDLINRQKEEVERWQGGYMSQKQEIANLETQLKALRKEKNKLMDAQMFLAKTSDEQQAEIERLKERYSKLKEDTLILQNLLKGMESESLDR